MRLRRAALFPMVFLCSSAGFAQEPSPPAAEPRVTPLRIASTFDVPFATGPFIAGPVLCGSDGAIFVRSITRPAPNGLGNLIAISSDGQQITTFETSKIADVVDPMVHKFFVRDTDVYMLGVGKGSDAKTATLRHPDGSTETQVVSTLRRFIARFRRDGTYMGAVSLDIPMQPQQFGVFPNGDFLVAGTIGDPLPPGITKKLLEARIALVKSNGQFNRFIDLKKDDIRLRLDSDDLKAAGPQAIPWQSKQWGEGFNDVLNLSSIVLSGSNLLLLRPSHDIPAFSISPGGEVEAIHLGLPNGYNLDDLKTTRDSWLAMYSRPLPDEANNGRQYGITSIDPKTGKALVTYAFDRFPGFGLACTDGVEFSFLTIGDKNFKIVKYTESHASSSTTK